MKKIRLRSLLLFALGFAFWPQKAAAQTWPTVYMVGHSLVNLDMPYQFRGLRFAAGQQVDYKHHVNIGAGLKINWGDPNFNGNIAMNPNYGNMWLEHGSNHLTELTAGHYDFLVMTEALPLVAQQADTTIKYARRFYNLANQHNAGIKSYFYQTWESCAGGNWVAWRAAITNLRPYWENLAAQIPPTPTSPTVKIVPAGLVLAALYDTLQIHPVGWIDHISDIFSDAEVHMNNTGNYLVACAHYATLFGQSPVGLPAVLAGPYQGTTTVVTDAAVRQKLQQIAWAVVSTYAPAGVLPVEYLEPFSAKRLDAGHVQLDWATASEVNSDLFEIEKSRDGEQFETLFSKKAAGFSSDSKSYSARVECPESAFFRLKSRDFDGSSSFSNIVFVVGQSPPFFKIWPTLADDFLEIELPDAAREARFRIFSMVGKTVASVEIERGTRLEIGGLEAGFYFLEIEADGLRGAFRFLKK